MNTMTKYKFNRYVLALLAAGLGMASVTSVHAQEQKSAGAGRGFSFFGVNISGASKESPPPVVSSPSSKAEAAKASEINVPIAPSIQQSAASATPVDKLPKAPEAPKLAPVASLPSTSIPIDTDSAINPLTGKSFSEERLTRLLNANKLVTEITRQQVDQAKLQADLSSTADKRQADSAKSRSDAINVIPVKPTKVAIKDSLKEGEQLVGRTSGLQGNPSFVPAPLFNGGGMTSGVIRIGDETFQPTSRVDTAQARVTYVDAQPVGGAAKGGGSGGGFSPVPLSPIPSGISTNQGAYPPGNPMIR